MSQAEETNSNDTRPVHQTSLRKAWIEAKAKRVKRLAAHDEAQKTRLAFQAAENVELNNGR